METINFKAMAVAILIIVYLYNTLLAVIHMRSAKNPIPANVSDVYDEETYRKWRSYHAEKSRFGILTSTVAFIVELLLMACGCAIWSEEDEPYLEIMAQRMEPFEDGADGAAAFSHAVLKERERFGRWLLSEDMSMALNGLLVLMGRLRHLLRHERKQLAEEEGEAKHRALFPEAAESPKCPVCGSPMRLRTAKTGTNAGCRFWGCTQYPACRGVREIIDGM